MIINDEIEHIKNVILNAVEAEKIYLFGSYARGEENEDSDYDIYIVLPDKEMRQSQAIENASAALLSENLYKKYKKPVDVLAGYSEVFNRRKKFPTLERVIEKEGVVLYEKQ